MSSCRTRVYKQVVVDRPPLRRYCDVLGGLARNVAFLIFSVKEEKYVYLHHRSTTRTLCRPGHERGCESEAAQRGAATETTTLPYLVTCSLARFSSRARGARHSIPRSGASADGHASRARPPWLSGTILCTFARERLFTPRPRLTQGRHQTCRRSLLTGCPNLAPLWTRLGF